MQLLAGTSGYAYKEWKGPFYPEDLPAAKMLQFYAERLPAVEINNTFYRLPKTSVLERWAEQVPEGFRFSIKASRKITHFKRLKGAEEETGYLLDTVRALGERLGVVLFQLPPNLKLDLARFDGFLNLVDSETPAAFEFRHPSWYCDEVLERLRDRGFALVLVDDESRDTPDVISTADWGYVRLRRPSYEREDLARWARLFGAQPWDHGFVFFKHEDAGAGPALASEFLQVGERLAQRKGPAARPSERPGRKTA